MTLHRSFSGIPLGRLGGAGHMGGRGQGEESEHTGDFSQPISDGSASSLVLGQDSSGLLYIPPAPDGNSSSLPSASLPKDIPPGLPL